ncbi:MAG TPA: AAA family ATPase [Planctomycetota bacterium]|nr:AAA family ATPase [Planctomycetota bacterium]
MPRVISIMNQKGGVGKTTTTLNLGAALAARGRRVLLVDLDPQANLTLGLGKRASDLAESVYELLTAQKPDVARLIMKTSWENLDLVPSHIDLSGAEIEMITMIGRESKLTKALDPIRGNYDYVLIDCLPSLSLLTVNAMAASSEVFVPLQAHPFALEGLGKLFEVVGMIREAMNPQLKVTGVLVTMFDGRTNVARETLDILRNDARLKEHIFTTTVKQNIRLAESQKEGVPVMYFDASCHAAKAYQALGEEVLEMEGGVLASQCAARITDREVKAKAKQRTFTPDLIAPPMKSSSSPAPGSEVPATPQEHATPVSALVSGNNTPGEAQPSAQAAVQVSAQSTAPVEASRKEPEAPQVTDVGQSTSDIRHRTYPANDPSAESIHPSGGVRYQVLGGGDLSSRAQAGQSGVHPLRFQVSDGFDDERPRLRTR